MKRTLLIIISFTLLLIGGCQKEKIKTSNTDKVIIIIVIPDPFSYSVMEITPDYLITHFDFTDYCYDKSFDFFSEPLPNKSEYKMTTWLINEEIWEEMIKIINENDFFSLPTNIPPVDGVDFASYYIAVTSKGNTHKSGGYGAGYGKDNASRRFRNIYYQLLELLNDSKQKNTLD